MNLLNGMKLMKSLTEGWGITVLLLAGGLVVVAQEPDVAALTNDTAAAEVLARLSEMMQGADAGQPEDMTATNGLAQTDTSAPSGNRFDRANHPDSTNRFDNPSRPDDRRSRSRRPYRSRSDQSNRFGSPSDYSRGDRSQADASAGTNSLDYAAFKIIVDRNIFDPNRYPRRGPRSIQSAPKVVDSLTLVGIMSYERGSFAFFDGTSADYKKALKLNDSIAGYKVTNIAPNSVKLATDTNEMEMSVGMALRREEDGPWTLSSQAVSYAAAPASTSTNAVAAAAATGSDTTAGGAESDVIKRLMQRRQQE